MLLTKGQISEQMCKHAQKKNGLHDLMEIMLESMMVAERSEFLVDNPGNKVMVIVLAQPMDMVVYSSSVSPVTVMATSILRSSPSCVTRRRNVTVWQECSTQKV